MSGAGATQPEAVPDGGTPGAPPDGADDGRAPVGAPGEAEPQPVSAAHAAPAVSEGEYYPEREYYPDGEYYPGGEYDPEGEYYPDGEYYPGDWERQPVSKLAIAALVSGLLALLPLALGFGIAALIVIRRTGRRGSRMALGGIYSAWIWVLIAVAVGGLYRFTHGFQPQVHTQYRPVAAYSLQVGDCFNITQNAAGFTLAACGSPHQAEVYGRFKLGGATYPGAAAVQQDAAQGCAPLLQTYVSSSLANIGYDLEYVYPDSQAWAQGERTVICETRFTNGSITGSIRAAG